MGNEWQNKIENYCFEYNVPIEYLADILYEPKVAPMIRGKGFEYSVMITLQRILPTNEWRVTKASPTDEVGFHDTDIRVFHKRTGKTLRLECKLAKKQGYRLYPDGHSEIRVKCMRSRTLGIAKVAELAPKLGIDEKVLSIHNDQYLPADFDVVVTSISNAFYRTNSSTGFYEWKPTKKEEEFLSKLNPPSGETLKDFVYRRIYLARTSGLAATSGTGIVCTRGACKNKTGCGFVPNYPIITFASSSKNPSSPWLPIEDAPAFFKE